MARKRKNIQRKANSEGDKAILSHENQKKETSFLFSYEYDHAYHLLLQDIWNGFHLLHPYLRLLPPIETEHQGPVYYSQSTDPKTQKPLEQLRSAIRFRAFADLDVRDPDLEEHTVFLYDLAQARLQNMVPNTFESMGDVATAHGNELSSKTPLSSWEQYIQTIDKIQINFDAQGLPLPIQLFAHPETQKKFLDGLNSLPTLEQQARIKEIMARKKAEYHARNPARRLSCESSQ